MELSFLGAKVPGNERSPYGTFVPVNESSLERKFLLPYKVYQITKLVLLL